MNNEISPEGLTFVWDISDGTIKEFTITPADFGLPEHSILAMKGGNGAKNAEIMDQLLDNKLSGPILDFVLLNAAALLYVSGMGKSFIESVAIARESISSGKAREQFTYFLKASSA